MCGGIHYGEVKGLVSAERWSNRRAAELVLHVLTLKSWLSSHFTNLLSPSISHAASRQEGMEEVCHGVGRTTSLQTDHLARLSAV